MAESFSFDVVSDFERQELVNTLDQVKREISQRYDLKDTDTTVDLEKENIYITTNSKQIRDNIKKINVSINGETLRVSSKSKNDLQLAIKLVSDLEETLNIPLKANNFR